MQNFQKNDTGIAPQQHVREARNVKEVNNVKGAFGTYLANQEVQFTIYFLSSRSKPTIRN